jgi:rod shape-determining protein MreD
VSASAGVKAAVLLFVAAILQVSIFTQVHVLGGVPDLVLVTLVGVSLLRGSVLGSLGGFFAGLLVDTATLGQLGLTSLLLTIEPPRPAAPTSSTAALTPADALTASSCR